MNRKLNMMRFNKKWNCATLPLLFFKFSGSGVIGFRKMQRLGLAFIKENKMWIKLCGGQLKPNIKYSVIPQEEFDALKASRVKLVEALKTTQTRLLNHGEWDEGCFYYAGKSASSLEEPLNLMMQALKEAGEIQIQG